MPPSPEPHDPDASRQERESSESHAPRLPYLPALDGLRAIAVLAVLLYHANLTWIPGGFLGVEMFFVISGYLITSLLLVEWAQSGDIDFPAFWLRRARRLLPALFVLLLMVVGYAEVFLPTEVAGLRGDALSTAGYVNNWYQIFSHKSYFESVGRPSLLRHMWSLAVEEQFYLCWPLVFTLFMRRLKPRQVLALVLAGALVSMLLMAALFQPNSDPSRVYYGTDTRAAGLLLGVALAFLWRPGTVISEASGPMLDAIGLSAFVTLAACCVVINEFQPLLYRGGFALTALVTAELVAIAVHPRANWVPRTLAWTPLRWVGLRSYGIYLWHFPVFMLTRPQLDLPLEGLPLLVLRFGLTLGVAALSYHFVETPIRQGALGRAWKAWRNAQGQVRRRLGLQWGMAASCLAALFATAGVFLLTARTPAPPEYLTHAAVVHTLPTLLEPARSNSSFPATHLFNPSNPVLPTVAGPTPIPVVEPAPLTNPPASLAATPPVTNPDIAPPLGLDPADGVTAIGDSVMEGVAGELRQVFGPNLIVDADQGRLPWDTPAIVRNLHAQGKIHSVVILHIGNNGFLSSEMFGEIMAELRSARRVVVVNLKVPRRWESLNNKMLATAVHAYPNAVLVDWHAASGDRPKLFWKDGIHVRAEGARVYTDLITHAVRKS